MFSSGFPLLRAAAVQRIRFGMYTDLLSGSTPMKATMVSQYDPMKSHVSTCRNIDCRSRTLDDTNIYIVLKLGYY